MKTTTMLLIGSLLASALAAAAAEPEPGPDATETTGAAETRTWTNSRGQELTAVFVKLDAGVVHLKRADGKMVKITLSKLSPADRKVANALAAGSGQGLKPDTELDPEPDTETADAKLPAGCLSKDEIAKLQEQWFEERNGEKTGKSLRFSARVDSPPRMDARTKRKYARSGKVPYRIYADLFQVKMHENKRSVSRVSKACKFYLLDSEGNLVLKKKSIPLLKLCPT